MRWKRRTCRKSNRCGKGERRPIYNRPHYCKANHITIMDKHRAILIVCIFMCLCFTTITVTNSNREVEEEQKKQDRKAATSSSFWLWERLKSFYSLYSKIGSPATWQWQMLKEAFSRFISPRLGFSKGGDEALRAEKDAAKLDYEKKTTSSEHDSKHQNEL